MHVVLFYFSGTGNTWWASTELKKALEQSGNTVDMYSLENPVLDEEEAVPRMVGEADQVIIGYPTYGSDLPANVRQFISDLPTVADGKRFGVFCTHAAFTGDGNIYFRKQVEDKGYRFLQSFQITLTTNFNVAMFPFSLSKPAQGRKLEKKKSKAIRKIEKLVGFINEGKEYLDGNRFYQTLLGGIQRHFFRKQEESILDGFKFFKDRCVKCNLCVETCPQNNWFFDDDGELQSKGNCILCFRCYNFCPQLAINFGKKISNPEKYKRFHGPVEKLKISDIRR